MSTPLRDRKRAKTRQRIGDVAFALFSSKGFGATTIDEIAEAAEVSRSTFFRYFPTKEDAAFPERAARLARFEGVLAKRQTGESDLDLVRRAFEEVVVDYVDNRTAILSHQRLIDGETALFAHQRKLDMLWIEAIAEAVSGNTRRSRFKGLLLAHAIMGAINAVIDTWFGDDGQGDLVALGEDAFHTLEHGLGATYRGKSTPRRARR